MKWIRNLVVTALIMTAMTGTSEWLERQLKDAGDGLVQPELIVTLLGFLIIYLGVLYRKHWRFDVSRSVNRDTLSDSAKGEQESLNTSSAEKARVSESESQSS